MGEIPLQVDLFSGELVDNRSDYQKRLDREREKPQQQSLFSAHQAVELARHARPWLAATPQPSLVLEVQDVRTEEERDREVMREAEKLTAPMFTEPPDAQSPKTIRENSLISTESVEYRVALFHLGKAELIDSRADLKDLIEQLQDTDIEAIALEAEEALRVVYAMVLNITLTNYLTREKQPTALG